MALAVILGIVAVFVKKSSVSQWAIAFLGAVVFLREFSVYTFHGSKLAQLAREGLLTDEFVNGAKLISDYNKETRPVMLVAVLLLVLLGYRLSRRSNQR